MKLETVKITGINKKETEYAVLYSDGTGMDTWISKSHMEEWPVEDEEGTFTISEWIVTESELI